MKRVFGLIVLVVFGLLLISCDGTSTTKSLRLHSQLDNHTTVVNFNSKLYNYIHGDMLSAQIGKAKFLIKKDITIKELKKEIKENNDLEVTYIDEEFIIITEDSEMNKSYSYFIMLLSNTAKQTEFLAGELRLAIKHEDIYKLILFPLHFMDQEHFKTYITGSSYIEENIPYTFTNSYSSSDFLKFYEESGWYDLSSAHNELSLKFNGKEHNKMLTNLKLEFGENTLTIKDLS